MRFPDEFTEMIVAGGTRCHVNVTQPHTHTHTVRNAIKRNKIVKHRFLCNVLNAPLPFVLASSDKQKTIVSMSRKRRKLCGSLCKTLGQREKKRSARKLDRGK